MACQKSPRPTGESRLWLVIPTVLPWLLLSIGWAAAATVTATFGVNVTVQATCVISTSSLSFGTYTSQLNTATASLSITCSNTTPYNVGLNAGLGSGATVSTRTMTNGTTPLNYGMFQDTAHTINWGNTIGTDAESGTGTGAAQSLTVYGQIPPNQFVTPGSYSDTVTATVTY